MDPNEALQAKLHQAFAAETALNTATIGIIAHRGVVTLTGTLDTPVKKQRAETVALGVEGVRALINKLTVSTDVSGTDEAIAAKAADLLGEHHHIPDLSITVEQGCLTLSGEADSAQAREAAAQTVSAIGGLKGIINNLTVRFGHVPVRKNILERALQQHPGLEPGNIRVEVWGQRVILDGYCGSPEEKETAERIIRDAPGVREVYNRLEISNDWNASDVS